MSNLINKVKDAVSGGNSHPHDHSQNTNAGPHSSNAANKVDPRVDSDYDGQCSDIIHSLHAC